MKVAFSEFDGHINRGGSSWGSITRGLERDEQKGISSPESKTLPAPVQDDALDPLGWPRPILGLMADSSCELDDRQAETQFTTDESDDLVEQTGFSETDLEERALSPSKDERLKKYETKESAELISDEEEEDKSQSDEGDDDEVIGYVSQDSDDDDIDATQPTPTVEAIPDLIVPNSSHMFQPLSDAVVQDPPCDDSMIDLSAEGAYANGHAPPLQSSTNECDADTTLSKGPAQGCSPGGAIFLPPPPPPPPPPGSKRKKKNRNRHMDSGTERSIPLLPPPSEAKIKLWEQSKARETGKSTAKSPPSRLFVEARSIESSGKETEVEGAEERQEAVDFFDPSNDPKSLRKAFSDLSLSPASSALILQDVRMAEKVDLAIIAASDRFEEQLSRQREESSAAASNGLSTVICSQFPYADENAELTNQLQPTLDILNSRTVETVNEMNTNRCVNLESNHEMCDSESSCDTKAVDDVACRRLIAPKVGPSAFTLAVVSEPGVIPQILDFLGDPVAVCRMKMINKTCFAYIDKNEHKLMRDAVRLGGMNMNVRPYFWLWITLNMSKSLQHDDSIDRSSAKVSANESELISLERIGREGKWHQVIERDVSRAFGTLPPHKTGARLRTDSIVRALITWGKSRVMRRGVKGLGEGPLRNHDSSESDDVSLSPTDTVSDWGGVTPVGSFSGSFTSSNSGQGHGKDSKTKSRRKATNKTKTDQKSVEELALGGNMLTDEMKIALQRKLSFVLHALAAAHPDVGYCQGMDYLVAHLLRILQDTIRWKAAQGTMPSIITSALTISSSPSDGENALSDVYSEIDQSLVVEETCFRVMHTFFTVYNLQHFYWPELRCLKTCCRVFEKIIHIKLPVLADHFEHHELNVGLFALGWFQTLFLYLPSMPSATVCHMWDIWLVERSFKIFFRVGTAILFLSQPILLNHELEGMMGYLNTFPDATLLSPDILIACALQIKITNRMLMDLEREVKDTTMTC
jgi:Rab-GTPase-TBC domain